MKIIDKLVKYIEENKYYQYTLTIGILLFLFAVMLYSYPLGEGHDLQSHLGRLAAMSQAIIDGVYPAYFDQSMALGYGFATKFFYGDLVLLPFALLVPHIGVISSYYAMIVFYSLLCAFLSFVACKKVFNNNYIALIFTIIYTFSYYRMYDVYNRAAVGESICLTFLPIVFWGAYEIIKGNYKKWYIITIGFSMMIFAHVNTPAIIAFVLTIICVFCYKDFLKERKRIYYLLLAAGVTVLLTAYFTFPLLEHLFSNEFYFNTDNGARLTFNVPKGEDVQHMVRGLFVGTTYMYPEIGGIGIVITMILCFRMFLSRKDNKLIKRADFFLVIALICMFIVSPLYPWGISPFNFIGFIQFSFRFYAPATFLFCVAASIYFYEVFKTNRKRYLAGIPFIVLLSTIMIYNSGRVYGNHTTKASVGIATYENSYFLMGADYMPSKMPMAYDFIKNRANDSIRCINSEAKIENFERTLRVLAFDFKTNLTDTLELPLTYYKGYKAEFMPAAYDVKIAECLKIEQSENGLVQIPVSKSGSVKVFFGGTIIQNVSLYITLLMTILLTVYIVWFNRKERKK